ncbi:MAG: type II toxin-antitoxin system PemK/MazF family toxin [Anaerolineae bacterium]
MTTLQMRAERSEVWLVRFPFTDLSSTKLRPAVVLAVFGEDVVVVGVFSRVPVRPLRETWVVIEEGEQGFAQTGLAKPSVVKAEKLAIIHRSVLQRRLGRVSPALMSRIGIALKKALHLE